MCSSDLIRGSPGECRAPDDGSVVHDDVRKRWYLPLLLRDPPGTDVGRRDRHLHVDQAANPGADASPDAATEPGSDPDRAADAPAVSGPATFLESNRDRDGITCAGVRCAVTRSVIDSTVRYPWRRCIARTSRGGIR